MPEAIFDLIETDSVPEFVSNRKWFKAATLSKLRVVRQIKRNYLELIANGDITDVLLLTEEPTNPTNTVIQK